MFTISSPCFFLVLSDPFTPYAYAPPWTPLNPGFYSIFGGLPKHLLVLHDSPPWKVALCLPYPTGPLTHTRKHVRLVGYMIEINWYGLGSVTFFFCVYSDLLTTYAYAPPWAPLNPGFYSIFGGLPKHFLVLHDSPPWKVALCLPYPTTPSPPRSQARGGTINYETL